MAIFNSPADRCLLFDFVIWFSYGREPRFLLIHEQTMNQPQLVVDPFVNQNTKYSARFRSARFAYFVRITGVYEAGNGALLVAEAGLNTQTLTDAVASARTLNLDRGILQLPYPVKYSRPFATYQSGDLFVAEGWNA